MCIPSAKADPIRVLLVDDDPDSFVLLRDMLRAVKTVRFALSYAEQYEEGLNLLCSGAFDAALVDYRLGDGDGITFIREASERGCSTPVLLLTGYSDEETDRMAMQAGASDYLNKDEISAALVERTVRYALWRKQAERLQQALNEINQTIHSSQDFDEVMQRAITQASAALGSDTAAVSFKEAGGWVVGYVHGFPPDLIGMHVADDQERHAVLAVQSRDLVAIDDAFCDERVNQDHMRRFGIRSVLVVPILIRGEDTGVIFFNYQRQAVQFTPAQIDFARKLASAISLALENARLFQDLEKEIQEHRQAEEALRISEERFRLALHNSPITVFTQGLDLRYTWIYNPGYDLAPDDVTGKSEQDLFSQEDAERLTAVKQQVIASGQMARCEADLLMHGKRAINDITIVPLVQDGKMIGITGVAVDITNLRNLQQQRIDDCARIEIQRQLIEQRERERRQVARDLHDGPLQNLVSMTLTIKCLEGELANRPEVLPALNELLDVLHQTIDELRSYASDLRPPALSSFGVEKAIQSHLEGFQQRHPEIKIVFRARQKGDPLADPARTALYRIYQELMNNVVKHANASRVIITFRKDAKQAILSIQDNGKGFKPPAEWLELARQNHLGLVGARERVEAVGGAIDIQSSPGCGTDVYVTVPVVLASLQPASE